MANHSHDHDHHQSLDEGEQPPLPFHPHHQRVKVAEAIVDAVANFVEDPKGALERMVSRTQRHIVNLIDFVSPAPDVDGIDPQQQEKNLRALIQLRMRALRGEHLNFAENKKLSLSVPSHFRQNSRFMDRAKLVIDAPVRPLSRAINNKPYLMSYGSCSGHWADDPEKPSVADSGFITFTADSEVNCDELFSQLDELCRAESAADPDCKYTFEYPDAYHGTGTYSLNWHWNHPVPNRERELIAQYHTALQDGDDEGWRRAVQERNNLQHELWNVVHEAQEKGIPARHAAFIEKASNIIDEYTDTPPARTRHEHERFHGHH